MSTLKAFEIGRTYANHQDVLNGLCSGFRVVGRTERTLSITSGTGGKPRRVRVRVRDGREWVRDGNGPYASAVWA